MKVKKLLSWLLVIALVAAMLPVVASAAWTGAPTMSIEASYDSKTETVTAIVGIGEYSSLQAIQVDIEYPNDKLRCTNDDIILEGALLGGDKNVKDTAGVKSVSAAWDGLTARSGDSGEVIMIVEFSVIDGQSGECELRLSNYCTSDGDEETLEFPTGSITSDKITISEPAPAEISDYVRIESVGADEELIPQRAYTLRNWKEEVVNKTLTQEEVDKMIEEAGYESNGAFIYGDNGYTGYYQAVKDATHSFTPDYLYKFPPEMELVIEPIKGNDVQGVGKVNLGYIAISAWSDPDKDGIYESRIATNNVKGEAVVGASAAGPIIGQIGGSDIYSLSVDWIVGDGEYKYTAACQYPPGMMYIRPAAITGAELAELFGPDTIIQITVCASTFPDTGDMDKAKDVYGYYHFYIPGRITDVKNCTVEGIAANGYEYTGSAITVPSLVIKDGETILAEGTDYTLAYKNNTSVGTATVTVTGIGNYTGTKNVTFKITKTQPKKGTDYTVTLPENGAYTGAAKTASADKVNANIGNITLKYNGSSAAPVKAGTYTVTADIAESANYAAMTDVEIGSFTITKAPLTISGATVADKVYNAKTDDAKVTAVSFDGLVNNETLALGTDYTATGVYASANASDSAAVTVTVAFKETAKLANYELPQTKTFAAMGKVSKATTTLTISAKDAVYTGAAYDTANITKTSNVETAPAYTYYADNNGAKGAALDSAPVNVGTYWVEGAIAETTNNSAVKSAAVKFSITKAPLTVKAKDKTITYGDAPANDGVTYEGFVNGEDAAVVSGLDYSYNYEQYGNVGTYAIKLTAPTADNYQIKTVDGKLTVEPKTVTLTWAGHTGLYYDGKAKAVTATAAGLVNNDEVAVTVSGGDKTDIGSYTAKATGLSGAKAANYKIADENSTQAYSIAAALESVSVTPATVTALIDQTTLTVKLVGYRAENEEITLAGLTVTDGKITANGVEYTVDESGVVVNVSSAALTENAAEVEKAEDADASITDAVIAEINDPATTSSGLDSAVAETVFAEAAKDETVDTVEVALSIAPKAMTATSLRLEIKPVVTYKHGGDVVKTETIANAAIKAPVTVYVKLPAAMPTANLIAKHYLSGGKVEYLTVTVAGGVAAWKQSAFSEVELISDGRTVTVNFAFDNGSGQQVIYTAADIGKEFPEDSKSGRTFKGWTFNGDTAVYKTLTDELLTALDGTTVSAEPSFGSRGGGTVTKPKEEKPTGQETANPFTDVAEGDYYYSAVMWAVKEKITSGITETAFAPNMDCTRAQAVTFLWRAAGEPKAANAANPFEDVSASDYYYDAVLWAVEKGITDGTSDSGFSPNDTVTRAQMVTMLWRAAGKPKAELNTAFNDVAESDYYAEAVAWATENGITDGTGAATFSPSDNCTRAQIVTFMFRNS